MANRRGFEISSFLHKKASVSRAFLKGLGREHGWKKNSWSNVSLDLEEQSSDTFSENFLFSAVSFGPKFLLDYFQNQAKIIPSLAPCNEHVSVSFKVPRLCTGCYLISFLIWTSESLRVISQRDERNFPRTMWCPHTLSGRV